MKQKIWSLFLAIIIVFQFPIYAYASEAFPMIVDYADILTNEEEADLEKNARELRNTYGYDIVILTVDSLEGLSAQEYADNYYDAHGYGYDSEGSGILFLLAMHEREWYISTCGKAIYIFTDYGIQTLGETSFSYLDDENYARVFSAYLSFLPEYFHAYDSGSPVDGNAHYSGDYYHGTQDEIVHYETDNSPNILLSLAIGILAASVIVLIMRSSMNTKRLQRGAGIYLKEGSFHLSKRQDLFLYSNVSKVRRQQNNTSKSGGGSSVHRSSGGRRHGGGGGKF